MTLQIVSNRLPIEIKKTNRNLTVHQTSGGLATGLSALQSSHEMVWTGWPGTNTSSEEARKKIEDIMAEQGLVPVWIPKKDYAGYYRGFSNKVIWPLFHYFGQYAQCREIYREAYVNVNRIFRDRLLEMAGEDDIFWINDYHLMLLPRMLREKLPRARIGFFLHIPFPHYEVYRQLPWRREILEGLAGADLIGFHTRRYADYFLQSVGRLLGTQVSGRRFKVGNRTVNVGDFPMGINYQRFADSARNPVVLQKTEQYRQEYAGQKIILSVDRLDYSKGILQRLKGLDLFLENNPGYRGKITLLELIVPSRVEVEHYQQLKKEVDEYSGWINGKYGTPFWTPVRYFFRSVDFDTLCALYRSADIALVTPLRDGMNLVAKEYVAVQQERPGALILSEFAGAAGQLDKSILINPFDEASIAGAIEKVLKMPDRQKRVRMRHMQEVIRKTGVREWATGFIGQVNAKAVQGELPE